MSIYLLTCELTYLLTYELEMPLVVNIGREARGQGGYLTPIFRVGVEEHCLIPFLCASMKLYCVLALLQVKCILPRSNTHQNRLVAGTSLRTPTRGLIYCSHTLSVLRGRRFMACRGGWASQQERKGRGRKVWLPLPLIYDLCFWMAQILHF